LALYECGEYGYFEPGVKFGKVGGIERAGQGVYFDQVAEKGAELAKGFHRRGILSGDAEFPVAQERADPAGIVEALGEVAEAVEEFAVDEVEPRGGGTEAAGGKWIRRHGHLRKAIRNGIKSFDTLRKSE